MHLARQGQTERTTLKGGWVDSYIGLTRTASALPKP